LLWRLTLGFRYVPSYLVAEFLSPELKKDIDSLNSALARQLNAKDSLFTEGKTVDGSICICLGVDTTATTAEGAAQHAQTIYNTATQLQLSNQIVDKISEVIQRGIRLAEEELTKEEENILYQEGVIRQLPVVGSVYNWLLPFEKPKVSGRSFHLGSQSLAPTTPTKANTSAPDSPALRKSISSASSSPSQTHRTFSTSIEEGEITNNQPPTNQPSA
jgi:hypothetical protein